MRVGLVSCAKSKLDGHGIPRRAKDLYISPLFRKARAYCEDNYDGWFILSAEYGLVHPNEEIVWYERTLANLTRAGREDWAQDVLRKLGPWMDEAPAYITFYLHAGGLYAKTIQPVLPEVERPLAGLGIGQQLAWYKARGY